MRRSRCVSSRRTAKPSSESPFIILADQGCVTRYLAAGLRAQEAIAKMEAYELDMIPDFIGGTGCHSGEGCHEHPHDED